MTTLLALSGVTSPIWVISLQVSLKLTFSLRVWLLETNKKHLLKNHDFKPVSWFLEPDVLRDSGIVSHLRLAIL